MFGFHACLIVYNVWIFITEPPFCCKKSQYATSVLLLSFSLINILPMKLLEPGIASWKLFEIRSISIILSDFTAYRWKSRQHIWLNTQTIRIIDYWMIKFSAIKNLQDRLVNNQLANSIASAKSTCQNLSRHYAGGLEMRKT